MRMLLKVKLPTPAYNRAIAKGVLGKVWSAIFAECPPEATYYLTEDGDRVVYVFADITGPEQIAMLSLPLYEHFEAELSLVPVMVFSDIQTALQRRLAI